MFEIGLKLALTFLGLAGWFANILGLPGNWLLVIMAAGCWYFRPEESASFISPTVVIVILCSALIGEVLEFLAGALGASRMGGSKRSTLLAMGGSIAGAVIGLFSGTLIPIPIVGNLIASLLLGGLGAFTGAVAGERWAGKDWDASFQIGSAAFWGRLLGTVGKAVCGTIACGLFLAAAWLP